METSDEKRSSRVGSRGGTVACSAVDGRPTTKAQWGGRTAKGNQALFGKKNQKVTAPKRGKQGVKFTCQGERNSKQHQQQNTELIAIVWGEVMKSAGISDVG